MTGEQGRWHEETAAKRRRARWTPSARLFLSEVCSAPLMDIVATFWVPGEMRSAGIYPPTC